MNEFQTQPSGSFEEPMPEEPKRYVSLCEHALNDHFDRNMTIVVAILVIGLFTIYGFARAAEAREWQRCQHCLSKS